MTITLPEIALTLLENKGVYPGDPQMKRIYRYKTIEGEKCFACFINKMWDDVHESPYVVDPVLMMEEGELTADGHAEIKLLRAEGVRPDAL